MPPSQVVPFSPWNGVQPPSGQVITSAPLSVETITIVLSAMPRSSSFLQQLANDPVELGHPVGVQPEARLVLPLLGQVREDVHPRQVVPQEERLARFVLSGR